MKVIAIELGYFDHVRRRPGDEFVIPDEPKGKDGKPVAFSKRWMKPADEADVKSEKKAKGK